MVDTTEDMMVDDATVLWDHDGGSMPESTRDNSIRDNEPTQTSKTETQTEEVFPSYEYAMERVRKSPLHSIEATDILNAYNSFT